MVDTCICCGDIVPEGQMVCPACEMDKCDRYHVREVYSNLLHGTRKEGVCYGTKEIDPYPCLCGGRENLCDFYPEKRKQALEKIKNGIAAIEQLKAEADKLGYRLVKKEKKDATY